MGSQSLYVRRFVVLVSGNIYQLRNCGISYFQALCFFKFATHNNLLTAMLSTHHQLLQHCSCRGGGGSWKGGRLPLPVPCTPRSCLHVPQGFPPPGMFFLSTFCTEILLALYYTCRPCYRWLMSLFWTTQLNFLLRQEFKKSLYFAVHMLIR